MEKIETFGVRIAKNGRILAKSLFEDLNGRIDDSRKKSVLSPMPQNTTQLRAKPIECEPISVVKSLGCELKSISMEVYYCVLVLESTGCRISEVLNIRVYDIASNGSFKVKGLKGSDDRLFTIVELAEYMINCKKSGKYPFSTFNRFFYYSLFKRLGIGAYYGNSKRMSVTHSFRHDYITNLKTIDSELQTTKTNIGHKNISNTQYYANSKKK